MGRVVGIDFGTSNSAIAFCEGGRPEIIPSAGGTSRLTPSVVAFETDGEVLVGEPARRQLVLSPDRAVRSIKRRMGTDWVFEIDGHTFTPQEIAARIISHLKVDAEIYLGEEVTQAVITVPAYFNDAQRTATREAGEIAGFEVLRVVNEPTAAAIAYGMSAARDPQKILVFDLGGGTFDVSILMVANGRIEVLATAGDAKLGGDDFDSIVADWFAEQFQKMYGIDPRQEPTARARLLEAAEQAKIELSARQAATVALPFLATDAEGAPCHLKQTLTREEFEDMTLELRAALCPPVRRALADARIKPGDLSEVLLVGGSTRMPSIAKVVEELTNLVPRHSVHPEEAVALGAALTAAAEVGTLDDLTLLDVTSLTLGIETKNGIMTPMIERNTTLPTRRSQVFTTVIDNQKRVVARVYQGEAAMVDHNQLLSDLSVPLAPAPRGTPRIEISFDIDVDGICHVTARDETTGVPVEQIVTGTKSLPPEQIDRMIAEAVAYEAADHARRAAVEARNLAEDLIWSAEQVVADERTLVPERSRVADAVGDLRTLVANPATAISSLDRSRDILRGHLDEITRRLRDEEERQAAEPDNASASGPEPSTTADMPATAVDSSV